jgi:hypothetical protein
MRNIIISTVMFLLLLNISQAQESTLTITDMKVEPSTVNPGGKVLISCRVTHSEGPMFIGVVGATAFYGNWVTTFPMLYDDGTYGDKIADDEVYSLEIKAADTSGEEKIVFSAVDTDKNEIESDPIILTVK